MQRHSASGCLQATHSCDADGDDAGGGAAAGDGDAGAAGVDSRAAPDYNNFELEQLACIVHHYQSSGEPHSSKATIILQARIMHSFSANLTSIATRRVLTGQSLAFGGWPPPHHWSVHSPSGH